MTDGHLELGIAWERHVGRTPEALRWLESVVNRYREPQRHYHDVRHLRWVVRHVEELGASATDLDAVIAAAFFHDAVYDPVASDNEVASARLATTALTELDWDPARIDSVGSMITATDRHDLADATTDATVLFAADLAVLAADPAGYSDYVRNVRREYHHVTEPDWVTGRSAVLRSFLERERIYAVGLDLDTWEQRARGNITSELDTLTT